MAEMNWAHPVLPSTARRAAARGKQGLRLALTGAVAVLVGLGVGVGAWSIAQGGLQPSEPSRAGVEVRPETGSASVAAGSTAVLEQAVVGSRIATTDWIAAIRTYATSRGAVAGTMDIRIHAADDNAVVGSQSIDFGVAASGQYAISYPGETAFSTAEGAQVQISDPRKLVMIQMQPSTIPGKPGWAAANGELDLPNDAISRILYPSRWLELMQTGNDVTIVYTGTEIVNGRAAKRYNVTFGKSTTKYAERGWDFVVDAASGVLVQYVIHYSHAAGGRTEVVQANLTDKVLVPPDANVSLPSGYRAEVLVSTSGAPATANGEVRSGDTVGALVTRAAESKSAPAATD